MATPPRFFNAETYYHIYNRGNRKERIFLQDADYERFLNKLLIYRDELKIEIFACCLMPNHFHFLLKQNVEQTLPRFVLRLCTSHAKYFNIKYEKVGRLFQDRFRSKPVESERSLLYLSKYIHLNPTEILPKGTPLEKYRWSSYPEYVRSNFNLINSTLIPNCFAKEKSPLDYKTFVESGLSRKEYLEVRDVTLETQPLGLIVTGLI